MKTLAFQSIKNTGRPFLVILHTRDAPDPEEWLGYIEALAAAAASTVGTLHAFVATDGGGPSSAQRKQIADSLEHATCRSTSHVFTDSAFVRGIVTALHWMSLTPASAHEPRDFGKVTSGCGLSPVTVLQAFNELQPQLPRVEVLHQIQDAMKSSIWRSLR